MCKWHIEGTGPQKPRGNGDGIRKFLIWRFVLRIKSRDFERGMAINMKGSHRIIVQNKRIRYDFEVKRNITVIRGDSATGKTALVAMIREHFENGNASGVELTCDKECTVLDGRTWAGQLSMMRNCIVFIDEGNDFVMGDDFADAIQKRTTIMSL